MRRQWTAASSASDAGRERDEERRKIVRGHTLRMAEADILKTLIVVD